MQLLPHNCSLKMYFNYSSILFSHAGELFDHGLDSFGCILLPLSMYSAIGRGTEWSVSPIDCYWVTSIIMIGFYVAHWEKYITGTLYMPWAYDLGEVVSNVCEVVMLDTGVVIVFMKSVVVVVIIIIIVYYYYRVVRCFILFLEFLVSKYGSLISSLAGLVHTLSRQPSLVSQ